MTLSVILALASIAAWIVTAFVMQIPAGWPHLLYAAAVILIARRIIIGRPKFLS